MRPLFWFLAQVVVETLNLALSILKVLAYIVKIHVQAAILLIILATFPILVPLGALASISSLLTKKS